VTEVYEKLKPFDAVAIAAGEVAFGPLAGQPVRPRRIDAPVWGPGTRSNSGFGVDCGTGL
jgi:hypothetical protein